MQLRRIINYFIENLGLPEKEIYSFLYFCASNPDFGKLVKDEDFMNLMDFFQGNIAEYRSFK